LTEDKLVGNFDWLMNIMKLRRHIEDNPIDKILHDLIFLTDNLENNYCQSPIEHLWIYLSRYFNNLLFKKYIFFRKL